MSITTSDATGRNYLVCFHWGESLFSNLKAVLSFELLVCFLFQVFPLDYILITTIVMYFIFTSMAGIRNMGIWFFWIRVNIALFKNVTLNMFYKQSLFMYCFINTGMPHTSIVCICNDCQKHNVQLILFLKATLFCRVIRPKLISVISSAVS